MTWDHSEIVARAVAASLPGCGRGFGQCRALGFVDESGSLRAGIVYHNWNPESRVIEISAASSDRRWTSRERIAAIFAYPFDTLGCRIVVARVSALNAPVCRLWRRLGAEEHRLPDLRGPGEDEMLYLLRAETWRQNPIAESHDGQARRSRAA